MLTKTSHFRHVVLIDPFYILGSHGQESRFDPMTLKLSSTTQHYCSYSKVNSSLRQGDPPHKLMAGKLWNTLGLIIKDNFTKDVTEQLNK